MRSERSTGFVAPLLAGAAAVVAGGIAVRSIVRSRRRFDLRGKTVLITGGSRGYGLELARQLCGYGVKLAICARDEAELREAHADLQGRGAAEVLAATCDITDKNDVVRFVDQVRTVLGPIDVLINNAGIITVAPFEAQSESDFQQAFETHVGGPLAFIRAVLPDMKAAGGGRIVNIGSVGGLQPAPHMAAYVASKHALVGLSETIRAELLPYGVYVTLVNPGVMRTGSPWHAYFKGDPQAEYAWFAATDNTPGVSISAPRIARQTIDALIHGDAILVTPVDAWLSSMFHGAFSGLSTEIVGLIARLMPGDAGVRDAVPGQAADVGQLPGLLQREQLRNARKFNQRFSEKFSQELDQS